VETTPLSIEHAFVFTPKAHADDRGVFLEWYRHEAIAEAVGFDLTLRQANTSVSQRGVVRGVHYALVPPGQAKYVTVTHGSAVDYVIDLRVGSPGFGRWEKVVLDTVDRRAVYLAEGLGHAFVSLEDDTVMSYLVSQVFNPTRELAINPLDPDLGLDLGTLGLEPLLSPKDAAAPTLQQAIDSGALPLYSDCVAYYRELGAAGD
jgi:dTDP-4-dehydrorhamnose 3,5-epimerase